MNKPMTDRDFIAEIIKLEGGAFWEGQSDGIIVAELERRFSQHTDFIHECLNGTGHPDLKTLRPSVPNTTIELF